MSDGTARTTDRVVVDRDVEAPMRDGVILRADVYRPETGAWPVLLQRTPYSKEQLIGTIVLLNPVRAARAGYAVVVQDVRGRFESEGEFYPFVNEGADGHDSVEWAAAQPWSNGRVGMYGSSYMAAAQWQAAVTAPPHLEAIAPIQASSDYYEGRSYRGGAFELGALLTLSLYALGGGVLDRIPRDRRRALWHAMRSALDDLSSTAATRPLEALRNEPYGDLIPFFFDWLEHDAPDEYWDRIAVAPRHHEARVPALHVSSWFDQFLVGTLENFLGMRERAATEQARDNQFLMVGPWGHYAPRTALNGTGRVGELDVGLSAVVDNDRIQNTRFDRWRNDDPRAWRMSTPVRIFVMGENTWRDEATWPPTDAEPRALHLREGIDRGAGRGGLTWEAPADERPDHYLYDPLDPVPTRGGAHLLLETGYPQGPIDQRAIETRHDVLVYTSAALDDALEVTGPVEATLFVDTDAACTDFTVKLVDVDPDRSARNVCDGIRRVRSEDPHTRPFPVEIRLGATSHVFRPGHRMRVLVSSSDSPRHDANPNTGEPSRTATEVRIARQSIHHDREHPSRVVLPVVERT